MDIIGYKNNSSLYVLLYTIYYYILCTDKQFIHHFGSLYQTSAEPSLGYIIKDKIQGDIMWSLVSSLWIGNKNKIYYSCPENCLSLMFPLLFIGLRISCKSLHDRQSNLEVGQFSTGVGSFPNCFR